MMMMMIMMMIICAIGMIEENQNREQTPRAAVMVTMVGNNNFEIKWQKK